MEWFYSEQGQQRGPVSQEQLETLTRSGVVTTRTLVWRQGFANWVPYSTILSGGDPSKDPSSPGSGMVACAECGGVFPESDTIQIESIRVCATCKPIVLQKIREGIAVGSSSGIWRSGRQLVTLVNATLPSRCVKCNAPTVEDPMKRNLYWHPPAVYLTLLLSVIIYIVVGMITRKRGVAFVSICQLHRSARRNVILISWLLILGGIAAIVTGIAEESGWIGGLGGVALLGGIIYGVVRGRLVFARKINREHMWIGGCGPEFLEGFPEWTGPN